MNAISLSLRVTAPARAARVSIGRRQFSVGRPVEFDVASPDVSALECALGAAGSELVNGLREFARRRRVEIDAIEALVTAELEGALTYLEVVGHAAAPRISTLRVKVFVAAPDGAAVRVLFDEMLARLPLIGTLRRALDVKTELILTSSSGGCACID